jgi:hypothetical protein
MMRIFITNKKVTGLDASGTVSLTAYLSFIRDKNGTFRESFELTSSDVCINEIVMRRQFGPFYLRMKISDKVIVACKKFFTEYFARENSMFDCYAFVNLIDEVPPHNVLVSRIFWDFEEISEAQIRQGDRLLLFQGSRYFKHALVALTPRLGISVYGSGGDIEFSDISDMIRDFSTDTIYRITSKKVESAPRS